MENNNWKWYEDGGNAPRQAQPTQPTQQPQWNGDMPNGYNAANGPYANGSYNGNDNSFASQNGGRSKERKRRFTAAQFIVSLIVVALLFTSAGWAIGKSLSNKPLGEQTAQNEPSTSEALPSISPTIDQPSSGLSISSGFGASGSETNVVQGCMPSVVGIDIEAQVSSGGYWYSSPETTTETIGSGSGVIITADGYIVTNYHVISGAQTIKVYLQDGTEYEAAVVGSDSYTDLAVIKIEAQNLPAAVLGSSSTSVVGDTVYAIGNPLGVLATSVSKGIISGLDREITVDNKQMILMQVDASVNPGNSGGALFNAKGELIGIVNSKASGNNVEGIGFAIPIDTARGVVSDLMDLGFVSGRPYLGIVMQNVTYTTGSGGYNPWSGFANYTTHPQIYSIESGSAAEEAGLMVNDIILSFGGTDVSSRAQISALLYEYSVGDVVKILVQRGEEQLELSVTLRERTK